jgi:hypothetical protein
VILLSKPVRDSVVVQFGFLGHCAQPRGV